MWHRRKFVGIKTVSDCRNSCRVRPALFRIEQDPFYNTRTHSGMVCTKLRSNQGHFFKYLTAWTLNSRYNVLFVSFKSKQAQRPDHVDKTVDSKKRQAIKNRKQKHNLFHVPPGLIAGNRLAMSGIILWNSSGGKVFCRKHFPPSHTAVQIKSNHMF